MCRCGVVVVFYVTIVPVLTRSFMLLFIIMDCLRRSDNGLSATTYWLYSGGQPWGE